MNKLLIFFLLFIAVNLNAQQTVGKLNPGDSFINQSEEVLFYMPKSKVVKLLNYQTKAELDSMRVDKYKQLVSNMEMRIAQADSAIGLRSIEAEFWKRELEKNDDELKEVKIQNANLTSDIDRVKKSRMYYVIGGIVATSIVFIAVK